MSVVELSNGGQMYFVVPKFDIGGEHSAGFIDVAREDAGQLATDYMRFRAVVEHFHRRDCYGNQRIPAKTQFEDARQVVHIIVLVEDEIAHRVGYQAAVVKLHALPIMGMMPENDIDAGVYHSASKLDLPVGGVLIILLAPMDMHEEDIAQRPRFRDGGEDPFMVSGCTCRAVSADVVRSGVVESQPSEAFALDCDESGPKSLIEVFASADGGNSGMAKAFEAVGKTYEAVVERVIIRHGEDIETRADKLRHNRRIRAESIHLVETRAEVADRAFEIAGGDIEGIEITSDIGQRPVVSGCVDMPLHSASEHHIPDCGDGYRRIENLGELDWQSVIRLFEIVAGRKKRRRNGYYK